MKGYTLKKLRYSPPGKRKKPNAYNTKFYIKFLWKPILDHKFKFLVENKCKVVLL